MNALAMTVEHETAVALAEQCIQDATATGGAPLASYYRRTYAGYLHQSGRNKEAEVTLMMDYEIVSAEFGSDSDAARAAASALARFYEQVGETEKAEGWGVELN